MSRLREQIEKRINRAIQERIFPGCVIGVVKKDGNRSVLPFGHFIYDEQSRAVSEDSIYDIASITKAIPTSSLLLTLLGDGSIKLADPVVKYVPEFGNYEDKKKITVKHLLTYTLDLDIPSMASLKTKTADEIIGVVVKAPLKSEPVAKYLYANSTTLVTGLLIRNASGKDIDTFADEKFFKPLAMHRTTFHPEKFPKDEIVPTEFDDWRGRLIQGEVHDESTYILNKKFILGISGLFSTAPDLLNFMEMLIQGGKISEGGSTGLGWELNQPRFMGKYSANIFGKTGFTGCLVLCDPLKGIGMVFISNAIYPKRKTDSTSIHEVRRDLADIIFSDF